jgi:hypothetical protein
MLRIRALLSQRVTEPFAIVSLALLHWTVHHGRSVSLLAVYLRAVFRRLVLKESRRIGVDLCQALLFLLTCLLDLGANLKSLFFFWELCSICQ